MSLWLVFRIPRLKEYLTERFGEKFIREKIGNHVNAAIRRAATVALTAFGFNALDSHLHSMEHRADKREHHNRIDSLRREELPVIEPDYEKVVNDMIKEGPKKTFFDRFCGMAVYAFSSEKAESNNGGNEKL